MNRLLGILLALGLGLAAQRILTGPEPGIPRDALILFILAGILFVWNAQRPQPLRTAESWQNRPWTRRGQLLTLAGALAGLAALAFLWFSGLNSLPGLLLWPIAALLFLAGTFLEQKAQSNGRENGSEEDRINGLEDGQLTAHRSPFTAHRSPFTAHRSPLTDHWPLLILLAILAVAVFMRFYQLDVYPNGCQSDECNNGLDALKWLSGAPYTPYAETNEGQATLFTYLIAGSFKLFGVGVTQMRAASTTCPMASRRALNSTMRPTGSMAPVRSLGPARSA